MLPLRACPLPAPCSGAKEGWGPVPSFSWSGATCHPPSLGLPTELVLGEGCDCISGLTS